MESAKVLVAFLELLEDGYKIELIFDDDTLDIIAIARLDGVTAAMAQADDLNVAIDKLSQQLGETR